MASLSETDLKEFGFEEKKHSSAAQKYKIFYDAACMWSTPSHYKFTNGRFIIYLTAFKQTMDG